MSANRAFYLSIRKAIKARGLTYEELANEIDYSPIAIKRFMAALRAGRNGSRYIRYRIIEYFEGKIIKEEH